MKVHRQTISVVIPHYNQNQYLERTITSIASQLDKTDEILIVDDHSSQAPTFEPERWAPTVRIVVLPENCGPAIARNIGVEQAQHDYVAFLDADDIALPGRISAQLKALNANADWAGCVGDYVYQRNEKQNLPHQSRDEGFFDIRRKLLAGRIFAAGSTLMIRRSVFLEIGGYNPRLRVYEDWDLLLRVVFCSTIGHCGEPIAIISPSTRRASKDDRLQGLIRLAEIYAGNVDGKEYRSFMQALAYERASAHFRTAWFWSGLLALLIGFWYAPLIILRRLTARIIHGLP